MNRTPEEWHKWIDESFGPGTVWVGSAMAEMLHDLVEMPNQHTITLGETPPKMGLVREFACARCPTVKLIPANIDKNAPTGWTDLGIRRESKISGMQKEDVFLCIMCSREFNSFLERTER